jgi:hypothetical protein
MIARGLMGRIYSLFSIPSPLGGEKVWVRGGQNPSRILFVGRFRVQN